MSDSYKVGVSPNQISFDVQVGSGATCHTSAYIKPAAGVKTRIKDSLASDNGSIPNTLIGAATPLQGEELIIQTIADCGALPASVLAEIVANPSTILTILSITYDLQGGAAGGKSFTYAITDCVTSTDGKISVVTKEIDLIP